MSDPELVKDILPRLFVETRHRSENLVSVYLTPAEIQRMAKLKAEGLTNTVIAMRLGYDQSTISRHLKRLTAVELS